MNSSSSGASSAFVERVTGRNLTHHCVCNGTLKNESIRLAAAPLDEMLVNQSNETNATEEIDDDMPVLAENDTNGTWRNDTKERYEWDMENLTNLTNFTDFFDVVIIPKPLKNSTVKKNASNGTNLT